MMLDLSLVLSRLSTCWISLEEEDLMFYIFMRSFFQATLKGWLDIMYAAVDSKQVSAALVSVPTVPWYCY